MLGGGGGGSIACAKAAKKPNRLKEKERRLKKAEARTRWHEHLVEHILPRRQQQPKRVKLGRCCSTWLLCRTAVL